MLKKGSCYTIVSEKFGIGQSTVADIKKSESKLIACKTQMAMMGIFNTKDKKTMKTGSY